jgi:hypothetical protein
MKEKVNNVGDRNAVGGGAPWRRAGPQERSERYVQTDLGKHIDEEDFARKDLWSGRGVGRGPLWPENRHGFRKAAGWTVGLDDGAPGVHALDEGSISAFGAQARLQVFKALPGCRSAENLKDIVLNHGSSIGREVGCNVVLDWDGISRRHAFLEALDFSPGDNFDRKQEPASGSRIRWSVIGTGSNGTFLNRVRLRNGERCEIRDGDALSFGKGRDIKDGHRIDEKELVYIFVFRESPRDGEPPPPHGRSPAPALHRGGERAPLRHARAVERRAVAAAARS